MLICVDADRVRLSKRRKVGNAPVNKSRLIVKHRPLTVEEAHVQDLRLASLEPAQDEEEEEPHVEVAVGERITSAAQCAPGSRVAVLISWGAAARHWLNHLSFYVLLLLTLTVAEREGVVGAFM